MPDSNYHPTGLDFDWYGFGGTEDSIDSPDPTPTLDSFQSEEYSKILNLEYLDTESRIPIQSIEQDKFSAHNNANPIASPADFQINPYFPASERSERQDGNTLQPADTQSDVFANYDNIMSPRGTTFINTLSAQFQLATPSAHIHYSTDCRNAYDYSLLDRTGPACLNEVFGRFPSPALPLQILEQSPGRLSRVNQALQTGLYQRQNYDTVQYDVAPVRNIPVIQASETSSVSTKSASSSNAPTPITVAPFELPAAVPGKSWIKRNYVTKGMNQRSGNIKNFDSSKFYTPLHSRPEAWGSPNSFGEPRFQYNTEGELLPHIKLSAHDLTEYLQMHPLHTVNGDYDPVGHAQLRLWIQNVPADSAARYPTRNSDKCRYASCPVPNHTIHKGHFRAALDEQSYKGEHHDPFHCAGFVHLFCLEKATDFPLLAKTLWMRPDTRVLPEGKNKMAITRDHESMLPIVRRYMRDSPSWTAEEPYVYRKTLSFALTREHLRREPQGRQLKRAAVGGNSIDRHMNNLDLWAAADKMARAEKVRAKEGYGKRARSNDEELEWDEHPLAKRSRMV